MLTVLSLLNCEISKLARYGVTTKTRIYTSLLQMARIYQNPREMFQFSLNAKQALGHTFSGYIIGINRIFSMGLFCEEKHFI